MPSLDDMISQAFAAPKPPKDRSLDDMIGEAFGAPSEEPETRELNDWEVQESQQRQAELRGRFTSTAGTVNEDAAAYEQYAPPEQAPVDEAKLFARKTSLRSMPSNAGMTDAQLEQQARLELQPQNLLNEQYGMARDSAQISARQGFRGTPQFVDPSHMQDYQVEFDAEEDRMRQDALSNPDRAKRLNSAQNRQMAIDEARGAGAQEDFGFIASIPRAIGGGVQSGVLDIAATGTRAMDWLSRLSPDQIASMPAPIQALAFGAKGANAVMPEGEGFKESADVLNDAADITSGRTSGATGNSFTGRTIEGISRSITNMAPALLAGGGSVAMIGGAMLSTGSQADKEGREEGLSGRALAQHVLGQMAVEGVTTGVFQATGLGGVEKALTQPAVRQSILKTFAQATGNAFAEMPEEEIILLMGDALRKNSLGPQAGLQQGQVGQALLDTGAQAFGAGGVASVKSLVDAISKQGPQAIQEALLHGPKRGLEVIAGIDGRFSKEQRQQALIQIERIAKEQSELTQESSGDQRVGQEYADPIQGPNATGQPEAKTDAEIAESDEEIRKNTPQVRAPVNDPFGMPNISDSQAMQEAARRILRERKQFSETGIEKQIRRAIETGVPPALAAKELQAEFAQESVRESDNPESSGFIPSEAVEQYDQQTFPQRAADAIRQSSDEMIERAGYKQVDPQEAAHELMQDQINRVLDEVGVGKSVPQNDIEAAIAEAEKGGDDTGYVQDQREIKVSLGKKRGALLDDFEAEQQTRLKERMAGDRRVTVVNPHPVTGLLEGKWANQRLAEMGVERALGDGKKVTYVEGDFVNLGGLNNDLGQTAADNHLRAITKLFTRFVPKNADIAMTHKGGDEYGFHFVGMSEAEVRPLLEKALPAIQAYNKKHGLDKIAHTKTGKAPGTGVTYAVEEFDGKSHRSGVYKDKKGKDIQLNQAGALIFAADQKLETEKKKNGQTTERSAGAVGERRGGSGVAGAAAVRQEGGRPAPGAGVRQEGLPSPKAEAWIQPESSGKAVERKARSVTPEQVIQIIAGSKVEDSKNGYTVTLPDGQKLSVVFVAKVPLNRRDAKARVEEQYGKKITKEQFNTMLNEGRIEPVAGYQNGKIILGPNATAKDLAEEVVHAFIDKGVITREEYKTLAGLYSKLGKAPNLVEEDIAKAHQAWTGETETAGGKIFQRVFGGEQGPPKPPDSPETADSPSGEPYGRPELANNGKTQAERDFVDDVDQVRKERGEPAKKKDSDARESAKARFDADPEAAEKHVFSEGFDGSKAEDFHLGVLVQSRIFNRAMKSNSEADWTKAADAQNLIRSGGTEASANLRARADITMTPRQRLETMLITPDREHARMIRNSRTPAERRAALEKWAKRVVEIKNSLKIDLDGYEQMDEAGQSAVEDALGLAKNSTWVGMLKEIWRNFGLSAIKTHTKNTAGNAIHGSKGIFLDRLAESAMTHLQELGRKGRKIDAASLGEFKYVFRGMSPGLWNGLAKAGSTLKFGSRDNKLTEGYGPQIPGKIGHVIRIVDRLSGAADDLAHTMFAHMEVGAQAYRIARSKGLKGKELQERIVELMKPPQKGKEPSEAWVRALAAADRYTFKGDNSLAQGITKLRDEPIQIAGYTAPEWTTLPAYMMFTYVKTPVNIAFEGLKQFTPAGSLDAAIKMHKNYRDGKDIVSGEASRAIAQQIIMVGMIAAMYALKSSRDDEEQTGIGFTGANDFGNTAKGATGRRTSQANSIHIGPWAISHSWAEPVTTGLSLASDVIDAKKRGKSMVGAGVANLFNATTEKTFLKTFGDIVKIGQAVGSGDESRRDEAIRRFGQGMITGWVPNIIKNTSRNSREYMDETRVWDEGEKHTKMAWKRLYQASELPGAPKYFPKVDLFGQALERPQPFGTPYTDAAFRILSPADIKKIDNHVGDRLIVNWNNQQGVKEWHPNEPRPDYKKDGKTHYIPEDLYDRYLKESGEAVLAAVKSAAPSNNNFAKPTAQNIKWLKRTIKIQRDAWRRNNLGMTEAVQDDEEQAKD